MVQSPHAPTKNTTILVSPCPKAIEPEILNKKVSLSFTPMLSPKSPSLSPSSLMDLDFDEYFMAFKANYLNMYVAI